MLRVAKILHMDISSPEEECISTTAILDGWHMLKSVPVIPCGYIHKADVVTPEINDKNIYTEQCNSVLNVS